MTLMYQEYFEVEIFMEQVIFLVIAQKKKPLCWLFIQTST